MARPGTFTVETARLAGLASVASKAAAKKAAIERANAAPSPVEIPFPTEDSFANRRLERVRAQLDLIDLAIENEAKLRQPDGQRLNWLASAQERLAEQERQLAGRPLPGSLRPREDRSARSQSPVFDNSPPVPVSTPAPAPAPAPAPVQPASSSLPSPVPDPTGPDPIQTA